jgi:beta-glucosidase-like glycosyl hydrolase/CubicO group peptidase (beta-lactamase class C family)
MNKFRIVTLVAILLLLLSFKNSQPIVQEPDFLVTQNQWVDSVFKSLTPSQRLAQLFMIAAYSNRDLKHVREIKELIEKYQIGGLIWMQGGPVRQSQLANYYQSISKTPLFYSIDAEWGLSMRLDSTPRYPRQMTLGAIQNDSLIYYMGKQIAKECKRIGIHINFAPVADVNNNPLNPVIGMRSFGEDKFKVAKKAYMYMQGLQDEHVMANGKHFPGHGDTESDSHMSLPLIPHSLKRLDSLELYPFQYLFDRGLGSIMVAHLNIPSIDTNKNMASTLSPLVVNELLKKKMNFKGLVFTDALNMKGAADLFEPGIVDLKALLAGNDVLLFSGDVPMAISVINKAILEGKITQTEIDERCKKILKAKYWCGLYFKQEIATRHLYEDLNNGISDSLNEKLAQAAITILKNENNFLPLKNTQQPKVLEISIGIEETNQLNQSLQNYFSVEHFGITHDAKADAVSKLLDKVDNAQIIVLQVNKSNMKPDKNFGVSEQTIKLIDTIGKLKPTVLVLYSNPYLINKLLSVNHLKAVLLSYENLPSTIRASANVILGLSFANGQLPVSTNFFKAGEGLQLMPLSTKLPLRSEITLQQKFLTIDSIALSGIQQKAYPGCQILAMQNGKVIYQKSFGNYTYDQNSKKVDNATLYDIASITKIAASALALMKLKSDSVFDYKKTLATYLPNLNGTNKENLIIEDVLTHQAGLLPWIPFYQNTLDKKGNIKSQFYSKRVSSQFPTQIAENLFLIKGYEDSIYNKLIKSKLEKQGEYVYSDLGYYFMQKIIEQQSKQKLNDYVNDIYSKLGINILYNPLTTNSKTQIAPTEKDKSFRKQTIQGYVHDPGAALLGGVAGHAGLFSNAFELAKLMQLYLNKGELNGTKILDSNVVKDFTSCHYCPKNRRGLCFEKPELDQKKDSPVTAECSAESFGHAGFTGTLAWADPKNKLVFVFLSNRVYPTATENKLVKLGIRSKIHKIFYEAIQ